MKCVCPGLLHAQEEPERTLSMLVGSHTLGVMRVECVGCRAEY